MKLYVHPASHNSRRVVALAKHLGVELETIVCDITQGEQHGAAYRAINPNGLVPALVDGDLTLWESNAILQYLADHAGSPLWPSGAAGRAHVSRWLFWGASHLSRATDTFLVENLVKGIYNLGPPDAALLARAAQDFHRHAAVLEAQLAATGAWVAGSDLSIADFSLASGLAMAPVIQLPIEGYPAIRAWLERMNQLPAWAATAG
jgi:glutathione S-transferase